MNVTEETKRMSERLSDIGISDAEFCRKAGINKATWVRWKSGTDPLKTWNRAVNKFDALIAQAAK